MENIEEIYSNIIMEHSMQPCHKHELQCETCTAHGYNPNCGDDITLHIKLADDKIESLSFTGSGCAISQSSTDVMAEVLEGKTIKEAKELADIFVCMIDRKPIMDQQKRLLKDALAFQNISNMPARVKCAILAWKTLKNKLDEIQKI